MSKERKKVDALIDRALHPSTPTEEARSCAMVAIKLIREHSMLDNVVAAPAVNIDDFFGDIFTRVTAERVRHPSSAPLWPRCPIHNVQKRPDPNRPVGAGVSFVCPQCERDRRESVRVTDRDEVHASAESRVEDFTEILDDLFNDANRKPRRRR